MRRFIIMALFVLGVCSLAHAAVTTGTFGDQNSGKVYRMQVDTDGIIYTPQDTYIGISTTAPTATLQVGKGTIVSGSAIGANDVYFATDLEVDGKVYIPGAASVSPTGTGKWVCANAVDSSIYISTAACK